MRWKSKREERINRRKEWHDFFCLFPRKILDENKEVIWVWLETIECKGTYSWSIFDPGWTYEFRLKQDHVESQGNIIR